MKLLYNSNQIRNGIRKLFAKGKGRRVAISAFVGEDAPAYLPNPKGIILVCWPNGGGTNPQAIRELRKMKVDVMFSARMHIKLYWAHGVGAIVTSANLTKNALGEGRLHEVGVLIPDQSINIDQILKMIRPRKVTVRSLKQLDRDYEIYRKRNPTQPPVRRRGFIAWYKSEARRDWKLGYYEKGSIQVPPSLRTWLRGEGGSIGRAIIMGVPKKEYKEGDWILCFTKTRTGRLHSFEWMYAHAVSKVPVDERIGYNDGAPYQILQVHPIRTYGTPPFTARDPKLSGTFRQYIARKPKFLDQTRLSMADIKTIVAIYRKL